MKKIRLEFPSNKWGRIWLKVTDNQTQAFEDENFLIPITTSTAEKISIEISVPQKLELIQVIRASLPCDISFNWTGKEMDPYGRMPGLKKVSIIFNDRTYHIPVIDEHPNLDNFNYCKKHDYWLNFKKWSLTVCTFETKTVAILLWHPFFIKDLKSRKRGILLSKNALPCLWEKGGRIDEFTGNSTIICDANGNKKKPIFIKRNETLACSEHALIVIRKNDVIVEINYQKYSPFEIKVLRIINININEHELEVEYIDHISIFLENPDGRKHLIEDICATNGISKYKNAILSAYKKAICYCCNEPYFIRTE